MGKVSCLQDEELHDLHLRAVDKWKYDNPRFTSSKLMFLSEMTLNLLSVHMVAVFTNCRDGRDLCPGKWLVATLIDSSTVRMCLELARALSKNRGVINTLMATASYRWWTKI
jgi:hypothetical protein